ncbi:MAG: hypothetical protein GTO24_16735 [candidate division Zixibacteria bacterium]|nr:hypothetical protein [candidate division Zixibacteria bacterium]
MRSERGVLIPRRRHREGVHVLFLDAKETLMWLKKALIGIVIVALLSGFVTVSRAAENEIGRVEDIVDLVVLRPLGCIAIVAGTAVFVLTLPFTYPTHSVNKSAERFVVRPFKYTFSRPFPDKNL